MQCYNSSVDKRHLDKQPFFCSVYAAAVQLFKVSELLHVETRIYINNNSI